MTHAPPRRPSAALRAPTAARRCVTLTRVWLVAALSTACEARTADPSPGSPPPPREAPPGPSGAPAVSGPPSSATANPPTANPPTANPHTASAGTGTTARAPSDCPAWVRAPRCVAGEDVVGVASVRGIRDANLARTTAENRAVARALSEDGRAESTGPHAILEIVSCDGETWARVTVPRARVKDAGDLPRCP